MQSTLYDKDYHLWLEETAQVLEDGRFLEIDLTNLIEEIKDMGKREKKSLKSNLIVLKNGSKMSFWAKRRIFEMLRFIENIWTTKFNLKDLFKIV